MRRGNKRNQRCNDISWNAIKSLFPDKQPARWYKLRRAMSVFKTRAANTGLADFGVADCESLSVFVHTFGREENIKQKKLKKRKKVTESRCDAMRCDAPEWLRRFARFHDIKDSALNPRDYRGARLGGHDGERERGRDEEGKRRDSG